MYLVACLQCTHESVADFQIWQCNFVPAIFLLSVLSNLLRTISKRIGLMHRHPGNA